MVDDLRGTIFAFGFLMSMVVYLCICGHIDRYLSRKQKPRIRRNFW